MTKLLLLFLTAAPFAWPQYQVPQATNIYDHTPRTRPVRDAAETVANIRLADLRLPARNREAEPKLLGALRRGTENEYFVGWTVERGPGDFEHHIESFRGSSDHEVTLMGGPNMRLAFFDPTSEVLIDIQGGAYWGATYLLSSDRQSAAKLFESSDYEFADLNRDGAYELIAWNRRPFDARCSFGIFSVRYYPEVFVRSKSGYQKAWPPADWALPNQQRQPDGSNMQIVAGFADLGGRGPAGLIVLQDRLLNHPAQTLAVYRLEKQNFRLIDDAPVPPERLAFLIWGLRDTPTGKEIFLRTATPEKCAGGGDPEGPGTAELAYTLHGDRLDPSH